MCSHLSTKQCLISPASANLVVARPVSEFSYTELADLVKDLKSEAGERLVIDLDGMIYIIENEKHSLPCLKKNDDIFKDDVEILRNDGFRDTDNELVLAVARDSASTWALECIKSFNKLQPGLRLSILAEDCITERVSENATVVFRCLRHGDLPGFDRCWHIEYRYALFAGGDYVEKHGEVTLDNIHNHRFIGYSGMEKDTVYREGNWHIRGGYGMPKVTARVFSSSLELIVKMVSEGVGIGSVCVNQEYFYGYKNLRRVLMEIDGPTMKSYFAVRKGLSEQALCNVELFDSLFRGYFAEKGIKMNKA